MTSTRGGGMKNVNRSKRFNWAPPKGGASLFKKVHLIESTILFFLGLDIRPDRLLIESNRGNKIPSGPKMLPGEILPPSQIHPGNLDSTLTLEKPYHLGNGVFGWNR